MMIKQSEDAFSKAECVIGAAHERAMGVKLK